MFSPARLIRSFQYAWNGIRSTFVSEQNFRIQICIGILVLLLAVGLSIPLSHIAFLVLVVTFVLVLELLNTAWERMLDLMHPGLSPAVRLIKDLLAAFVFIASLGAVITGLLLLGPPLINLFF
ncbi:diacylglycerol kinase [Candidatus Uhrbacteria bacterium]|nr:diacylglycerol kinase [Candidatus Uhrbacteria bacterium]